MSYLTLLKDSTRSDEYVNATALCKHFGKNVNEWKREGGRNTIEAAKAKYGENTIVRHQGK